MVGVILIDWGGGFYMKRFEMFIVLLRVVN